MFNDDIPQWAKENLGCTLIATFGTESTKSAILAACRGMEILFDLDMDASVVLIVYRGRNVVPKVFVRTF